VPDEIDVVQPEVVDPSPCHAGVPVEIVWSIGPAGEAVTGEIEHVDSMSTREPASDVAPGPMGVPHPVKQDQRSAGSQLGPVQDGVLYFLCGV
jgi:hypothetical protein